MADDDIDDTDDIPEADDGDASEGEAVAKPVKPVARLGEIVASALGSTQREWLTKGLGDPLPPPESDSALLARAAARMDHETLRRQAVIDTILYRTLSILPKTVEPGDLDPDWAPRFFAAAADSRDPERQAIWCRMLAMEVERPGSIPLIALHRLPSLSADVLDWMRLFAGFAISNFVVRLPDAFFNERGLTSDVLLLLEEYGLLRTNRDLSKIFRSQVKDRFSTNLLYIDKVIRVTHADASKEFTLQSYRLTEFGATLARIFMEEGELTSDTEYVIEIVKLAQKQGFMVAQADILARASDQIVAKHSPFCDIVALTQSPLRSATR